MPIYLYENPETNEVIEVVQGISEEHKFKNEDGLEYKRVFTVPHASIDTKIDPHSSNDFLNKTKNKGYTVGDLWDVSKEASEKRIKETGKDKIKEKYFKNYSKKRKGMKHQGDSSK